MTYDDIYSRFFTNMTDPDFYKMPEDEAYDLMKNWLHNAIGEPHIRKIFSSVVLDDTVMSLSYDLSNSIDQNSDDDFVIGVLSRYLIICWYRKKVDSAINVATVIGGKEEKMIQSAYKNSIARLDSLEVNLKKFISSHGYEHNSYIGGES